MRNKLVKKENGMILFVALIILLLLSIVVYSGLYTGQLQESMAVDTGRGAVKTDQAAESLIANIEAAVFAENANATYEGQDFPADVCSGAACAAISVDEMKDSATVAADLSFKKIPMNGVADTYYKVQNLGASNKIQGGKGANYQLYRLTAVSFFADSKSAIESLIALPVKK